MGTLLIFTSSNPTATTDFLNAVVNIQMSIHQVDEVIAKWQRERDIILMTQCMTLVNLYGVLISFRRGSDTIAFTL